MSQILCATCGQPGLEFHHYCPGCHEQLGAALAVCREAETMRAELQACRDALEDIGSAPRDANADLLRKIARAALAPAQPAEPASNIDAAIKAVAHWHGMSSNDLRFLLHRHAQPAEPAHCPKCKGIRGEQPFCLECGPRCKVCGGMPGSNPLCSACGNQPAPCATCGGWRASMESRRR